MATEPPPPYNYDKGHFPPPPGPNEQPPDYSQATSNAIVVSQPGFQLYQQFRETPVRIICPSCRAEILTSTHYEAGTFTWVACLIIAFVGLWLFCCLLPFCLNSCKDVVHSCPSCRHTVGRYNRAG